MGQVSELVDDFGLDPADAQVIFEALEVRKASLKLLDSPAVTPINFPNDYGKYDNDEKDEEEEDDDEDEDESSGSYEDDDEEEYEGDFDADEIQAILQVGCLTHCHTLC